MKVNQINHADDEGLQTSRPNQLPDAVKRVRSSWFPVNGDTLRHIRTGFDTGRYEGKLELLVSDLKCDVSLYLLCVQELNRLLSQSTEENNGKKPLSMVEQLQVIGLRRLRSLLTTSDLLLSDFSCDDMTPAQSERLAEMIRSACITEALAVEHSIDSSLAYATALMRQLGLTLIAWNYPRIYQRVIDTSSSPTERDEALTKLLGFSPALLALNVVEEWGVAKDVRKAIHSQVEGDVALPIDRHRTELGSLLNKLCQVGEALARYSYDKTHPEPHADWHRARNEVLRSLGFSGFRTIEKKINEALKFYRQTLPHIFQDDPILFEVHGKTHNANTNLYSANAYIKFLPPKLQSKMQVLYSMIDPKAVSKEMLDLLTHTIIPEVGFLRGCIYLFDPGTGSLIPRLAVGERGLSDYKPFAPGYLSLTEDPLVTAYRVTTPVVEQAVDANGEKFIKFMAGAVGSLQRVGVLYLEPREQLARTELSNVVGAFKAIRVALADCLTLS